MGCGYEDDTEAEFLISTFELKIVFPIYREAIHLQRFTY